MIVISPLDILTGYGSTGTRPAHFTGQVTMIPQINVQINGVCFSVSLVVQTVQEMIVSWALLITISKCSFGKDHTFLVGSDSPAGAIQAFFMVTTAANICARCQYIGSEFSDWRTVEPISECNVTDIVLLIFRIQFATFLATDAQTAIPVDMCFVPGGIAESILIRHHIIAC
jgi:hypothetical protein